MQARSEVSQSKEQAREMLKKAVEAKKQLQAQLAALTGPPAALSY
jgi:hypothetical protein